MQKLKISRTDNGYILEGEDLHCVIEEKDPNEYDLEINPEFSTMDCESGREKVALKDMLLQITEYFGFQYDKYGKHNLKISFDRVGDHVVDNDQDKSDQKSQAF